MHSFEKKQGNKIRKIPQNFSKNSRSPIEEEKGKRKKQASISNLVSKHLATLAEKKNLPRYGIDSRWQFKLEFTAFGDRSSLSTLPLSLSLHPPPGFSWSLQSKKSNDPSGRGASSRCYAAASLPRFEIERRRDREEDVRERRKDGCTQDR